MINGDFNLPDSPRGLPPPYLLRVRGGTIKEQCVVRADRHDQQHTDDVQDGELLPEDHEEPCDRNHRQCERRHHPRHPPRGAQRDQQEQHDGGETREPEPHRLAEITGVKPVCLTLEVQEFRTRDAAAGKPGPHLCDGSVRKIVAQAA